MDTSDSEGCFESADEDFLSDEETSTENAKSWIENNVGHEKKKSIKETAVKEDVETPPEKVVHIIPSENELLLNQNTTSTKQEDNLNKDTVVEEHNVNNNMGNEIEQSACVVDSNENVEANKVNLIETLPNLECKNEIDNTNLIFPKAEKLTNFSGEFNISIKNNSNIKEIIKQTHFQGSEVNCKDISKVNQKTDSTENLWGDNEGWDVDDFDVETSNKKSEEFLNKNFLKNEAVDDLHGKDEKGMVNDLRGENKTETAHKKMVGDLFEGDKKETFDNIKRNEEKKETGNDLWGEEDGWEIEDENNVQESQIVQENITEKITAMKIQSEEENSWSSWGNWGISSVLSTAANITTSVSQGITTVLETSIGVPDPEELARQHKAEKEKLATLPEQIPEDNSPLTFNLGNLVSGVSTITKLVETTSTKVISGGLDTLETIGKKTMRVLQENDPGLKKKRAFLKLESNKPVLSQMLREAKEKAEEENKQLEKQHVAKKANYETIFDDNQGLVHLEALEMLSKQCDIKLESLLAKSNGDALTDMQETLDQVKELCELSEEDDDETSLTIDEIQVKIDVAVSDINIPITYTKLLTTWNETNEWIAAIKIDAINENEIHQHAIKMLAELTAMAVEQYHKAGELLLIKEHRSTADEADSLVQLTTSLSALISLLSSKYSEKLNLKATDSGNKEKINSLITNIFFEAANSSRYLEDAFQLLIPVLQVGAV